MLAIIIILGILGICMLGFGIILICEKEKKVGFWYLFFTFVITIIEVFIIIIEVNFKEETNTNEANVKNVDSSSISKVLIYDSQDVLLKEYYGTFELISDDNNYIIIINKS